jgi:hypothetical protein
MNRFDRLVSGFLLLTAGLLDNWLAVGLVSLKMSLPGCSWAGSGSLIPIARRTRGAASEP